MSSYGGPKEEVLQLGELEEGHRLLNVQKRNFSHVILRITVEGVYKFFEKSRGHLQILGVGRVT
jgi:hypothetical protein